MAIRIWDEIETLGPWVVSVRAATTVAGGNITLSGTFTLDGVALAAGDVVLVKNQTTGSQNGFYVVAAGAWARHYCANADADFAYGQITYVREGTTNGRSQWVLSTVGTITVGTTTLTYNRSGRANQSTAGTYGSASQVPVAVLNDDGTVSSFTNTNIAIGATGLTGLADTQILFGNSSGNPAQSSNLVYTGGLLCVGVSPSATIHAGGSIRAEGILYSRGTGSPVSSSGASSVRLQNTTASTGRYWYLSSLNTGELKIQNDNVSNVAIFDDLGRMNLGSSAPAASALLSLDSTSYGFLPPRMSTTQRNAISSPATGLVLFNTTNDALTVRLSSGWLELGAGGGGTVGPGGTNEVAYFNATNSVTSSPNFFTDPTNIIFAIGQPAAGTGRILVKGSTTNNSGYAWQGFNSSDVETSRISNDGYYQGNGLMRVGGSLTNDFAIATTLNASYSLTDTSGSRQGFGMKVGFSPTSGTGQFYGIDSRPTINQTGGANGITAAGRFGASGTLTAADFRGVWIDNTSGKGLWQDSTGPINLLAGKTGMGARTSPAYILDIDDTGAMRLPIGSDAQRPTAAAGLFRYSTTQVEPEFHDGTSWRQLWHSGNFGISGTNGQLAYFNGTNTVAGSSAAAHDGTSVALGTSVVSGQRLTILGTGNTSGSYALRVHDSGGANNQLVVRNDGRVGILQSAPIYPLHVEGSAVFGSAGANTTNSPRALNIFDSTAVMRIWRKTNTTGAGPSVELVWGPVTSGSDTANDAGSVNKYWDFYLSGQADQFGIRRRTGAVDSVAFLIQPTFDIQVGPNTSNSVRGGTAIQQAANKNSVAGDRQISRYALSNNSTTSTSFDLFLNGSSTYATIDNSPATSRYWGVNVSITLLVTARTSGTPVVGEGHTYNFIGGIKKIAGTYTAETFAMTSEAGAMSLAALEVTFSFTVSSGTGNFVINITRPAGSATYAAVATVETQEIAY